LTFLQISENLGQFASYWLGFGKSLSGFISTWWQGVPQPKGQPRPSGAKQRFGYLYPSSPLSSATKAGNLQTPCTPAGCPKVTGATFPLKNILRRAGWPFICGSFVAAILFCSVSGFDHPLVCGLRPSAHMNPVFKRLIYPIADRLQPFLTSRVAFDTFFEK